MSSSGLRLGGGLLLAAGWCLSAASPAMTQMSDPEVDATRPRPTFPGCDFIKKLGLDVLDDEIEVPDAWNQTSFVMADTQTELPFQVYAISNQVRNFSKLSGYPRQVSTRIIGAGGRDPLRARVRFAKEGAEPHWVLQILRRPRRGRTITLLVTFRCTAPVTKYQGKLTVTVPGRLPTPE